MMRHQAPPLSATNKTLLIMLVSLFLIDSIARPLGAFSLVGFLGLIPIEVFPLRIYTLLTYPWVETSLFGLLFNGLALWFLGTELESSWGRRVYLKFLLASVIGAGLLYTLLGTLILHGTWLGGGILVGPAGFTYALTVAYAVLYPERQFLMMFAFPVQAKWFCLIMAGVELYLGVFSGNPASWGHILSMAVAFVLIRYQTLGPVAWLFRQGPGNTARSKSKSSGHLKLVEKEDDKPKYWH